MKIVIIEEERGSPEKGKKKFHAYIHKNIPTMEVWDYSVHEALIRLGEKLKKYYTNDKEETKI